MPATYDDILLLVQGYTHFQEEWYNDSSYDATPPSKGLHLHLGLQQSEKLTHVLTTANTGVNNAITSAGSKFVVPSTLNTSDYDTFDTFVPSGFSFNASPRNYPWADIDPAVTPYTSFAGRCMKVGQGPIYGTHQPTAFQLMHGASNQGAGSAIAMLFSLITYTNGRLWELAEGASGVSSDDLTAIDTLLTDIETRTAAIERNTATLSATFALILSALGISPGDTLSGLVDQYTNTYLPDGSGETLGAFCARWYQEVDSVQTNMVANANLKIGADLYPLSDGLKCSLYFHEGDTVTVHYAWKALNGLQGEAW